MTEQIMTKNLYSMICDGGNFGSPYEYYITTSLMNTQLNRVSPVTNNSLNMFTTLKGANVNRILDYYTLAPVYYSKQLSAMTEGEIYGTPYETRFAITSKRAFKIIDDSTSLTTGLKLVTTHTNTSETNEMINGVLLVVSDNNSSPNTYNLILTKFDQNITLAPAESYQFTLDLGNIFQTFPVTIGS